MTTYRDASGIPHIRAADANAVAFEQGRATALDRAWQLDAEHRRGTGRLAEALGTAEVEWDAFARRTRIDAIAAESYERLSHDTRTFLAAYSDGVNAVLGRSRGAEHAALDVDPLPWRPWTPVTVFLVHQVVFGPMLSKIWRLTVAEELGTESLRLFSPETALSSGSNAFAVGGGRTASGLPLVAGDPHRAFAVPNVYAQVRLSCPSFDVAGFAFPGVPGVQHFGHAGEVAWGLTNASADYEDAFVEQLRRTATGVEALGPEGWEDAEVRHETIGVRGSEDVRIGAITTRRGPVVIGNDESARAFSVRPSWWATTDLGMEAILPLLHARSTADVVDAFGHWVLPVNNVVVADRAGDVRQLVVGRVPVRPSSQRSVAVAAEDSTEWSGWVSPLPAEAADTAATLVSANQRISSAYDVLGDDFAAPFRARRIEALLATREQWDADSAGAVLGDVLQTAGAVLLERIAGLGALPARAEQNRARLLAWDRQMTVESVEAALFVAVRERLVRSICASEQLQRVRQPPEVPAWMLPWFDVEARVASSLHVWVSEAGPLGLDVTGLLREALDLDLTESTWGEGHRYSGYATPPTPAATHRPLPGDTDCVFAAGKVVGREVAHRGPVARYVWDLSDRARSRWVVPLGAHSGAEGQARAWAAGRTLPVALDWDTFTEDER